MSFDQLSSLESQSRRNDSNYTDDPDFERLSQDLMNKLFTLTGNIARLRTEIGHLGTRRDTARVRERVHDLIEESSETFKGVGQGVKKIQTWEDVTVCLLYELMYELRNAPVLTVPIAAHAKIQATKALPRVQVVSRRVSVPPAPSP